MNKDKNKFGSITALGVGIGTALGVSLNNIALGVATGGVLGILFGLFSEKR